MLDEARSAALLVRALARDAGAMTARQALELATVGAARALGLDAELGSLEPGKHADLCAVSLDGLHTSPVYDVETALVFSASARDVVLTAVGGRVVYDRERSTAALLDESRLRARLAEISAKIVRP